MQCGRGVRAGGRGGRPRRRSRFLRRTRHGTGGQGPDRGELGGPGHRTRRHPAGHREAAYPGRPRPDRAGEVPHPGGGPRRAGEQLGIRRVTFAVDDIEDVVARLRRHGAELVGEVVRYGDDYRLCYVRGPEGIVVGLAEQLR
ncbi:VOC family protein [Streptomyces jumonjinensis]|uniref:VOC family protein n=1 Tax=Streptomyces jumonjinensis TaxID=1945 RepID=UPI003899A5F1